VDKVNNKIIVNNFFMLTPVLHNALAKGLPKAVQWWPSFWPKRI
jgi:hypothetical protein